MVAASALSIAKPMQRIVGNHNQSRGLGAPAPLQRGDATFEQVVIATRHHDLGAERHVFRELAGNLAAFVAQEYRLELEESRFAQSMHYIHARKVQRPKGVHFTRNLDRGPTRMNHHAHARFSHRWD